MFKRFRKEKLPIVFSKEYNVSFCGLQCLYPFDTEKGQHVLNFLKLGNVCSEDKITTPSDIQDDDLMEIHTERYLESLKLSDTISKIAEIPLLYFVPSVFIQSGYLKPMRFQTSGSILAAKLAVREGWAINLGGGFHHCSSDEGGSFSPYADVSLVVKHLLLNENSITNVMIIDLSARQGNGHERDLMDIKSVYIFDMYNHSIYPQDNFAKMSIQRPVELPSKTEDEVYLRKLRINLKKAFDEFKPDAIVYIAGTDIIEGDSLGELSISPQGIVLRDEVVFNKAHTEKIPIVMLLGTGFLKSSAQIITSSIMNLKEKGLIPSKYWSN